MVMDAYRQYVPRYRPNLLAEHIPDDYVDASKYFESHKSW